jgi:hypothetical protein
VGGEGLVNEGAQVVHRLELDVAKTTSLFQVKDGGAYAAGPAVTEGTRLEAGIDADKPFIVTLTRQTFDF